MNNKKDKMVSLISLMIILNAKVLNIPQLKDTDFVDGLKIMNKLHAVYMKLKQNDIGEVKNKTVGNTYHLNTKKRKWGWLFQYLTV